MPKPDNVGVGTAFLLVNDKGQVLLGKRKGAHKAGHWSAPGGWIDREDESTSISVIRELKEETGMEARRATPLCWTTEDHEDLGARTISLYHYCHYEDFSGEPELMEPHKCEEWRWFDVDALPSPLYPCVDEAVKKLINMPLAMEMHLDED
jgi:8-oxo-dGTP diphosphatase